jgi:hypothetical protein
MNQLTVFGSVLVAMLLSLPVIAGGVNLDRLPLIIGGLVLLGVAAAIPPALRFTGAASNQSSDEEEQQ